MRRKSYDFRYEKEVVNKAGHTQTEDGCVEEKVVDFLGAFGVGYRFGIFPARSVHVRLLPADRQTTSGGYYPTENRRWGMGEGKSLPGELRFDRNHSADCG